MMRNPTQGRTYRILCPIPQVAVAGAAALWWRSFGTVWPARPPAIAAGRGIVALTDDGSVLGVAGLRDATGGFLAQTPLMARLAFRAAPPTSDLVIDGIAVAVEGQGIGHDLIVTALERAALAGHPGLRAEVAGRNRRARRFFEGQGFAEVGRGRYGWPWSGEVVLMRRGLTGS